MTYARHIRMSCLGTLPGGEIFSFGLALAQGGESNLEPNWGAMLSPNDTVWNDLRDDVVDFWAVTPCANRAVLRSVKFAPIGTDGLYSGAPIEKEVGSNGTGIAGPANVVTQVAPQIALAVTTHTAGDIGRVKGRFYLPMPANAVESDGRIAEASRDSLETACSTFLNNLNNQPGLDVLGLRVVVASQGRKTSTGAVKFGPRNWEVNAVSVGRTLDTIRSRRNKLSEFRGTPTAVV